jgi:hypothetical protein
MRKLLLLTIAISLLAVGVQAQQKQDASLPLAKLETPVSVTFDSKDLEWLQYGGTIAVSVLVDKKGKATVADLTGPGAPCSDLSNKRLVAIRTAALEAIKKAAFIPANDADGKPVNSGARITLKVPARTFVPDSTYEPVKDGPVPIFPPETINGGIVNGKAVYLAKPDYPRAAHAERAGGVVNVHIVIDEKGVVLTADAVNGHPDLRYSSEEAACKAKFTPTLLSGHPVKVSGIVTFNFVP